MCIRDSVRRHVVDIIVNVRRHAVDIIVNVKTPRCRHRLFVNVRHHVVDIIFSNRLRRYDSIRRDVVNDVGCRDVSVKRS